MTSRTTGSFDADGERIYYESIGDGDPVVLCHGLGGNHACWWRVIAAISERHRVITWDQRGFGNSTRTTGNYGPRVAVSDLLVLLDHLALDQVQLVGQSMGGWVAMGLALGHRDRVRSLVLTDTLAGVLTRETNSMVRKSVSELPSGLRSEQIGRHAALGESFCSRHPDLAFLYQQISSMGDKPDDAEIFALLGSMRFTPEEVRKLDVPTLLVVGDSDALCPPEAMRFIAGLVPGADLAVIPEAGHSPYFEQPALWAGVVGAFLDQR